MRLAAESLARSVQMPWFVAASLLLWAAAYAAGTLRIWRRTSKRFDPRPMIAFAAGWVALVCALDSPLDLLSERWFWAHMTQHELLMIVAAPLLVYARPLVTLLWPLPENWRAAVGRIGKWRPVAGTWALLSAPMVAWSLHAVALWGWHAEPLFDAALRSERVHALQHISFFGSALLFWWALIHARHGSLGASLVYVFTTAAHNSILAALLTFSPRPWYSAYAIQRAGASLTPLEDQQLGGLIMWVPGGALLLIVGLWLLLRWLRESEQRASYSQLHDLVHAANVNR
jgi:putative membrane protein